MPDADADADAKTCCNLRVGSISAVDCKTLWVTRNVFNASQGIKKDNG